MDPNEMLVRTTNAAREAREKGFHKTADAFDEIVERLIVLMDSRTQTRGKSKQETCGELHQVQ